MFTEALVQAQDVLAHGPWGGGGPGWLFLLVPLFWIGFFILLAVFIRRGPRFRGGGWGGWGGHSGPSAESTLANRFANGDIDEQEYRARLEVLRADQPRR
ncbi:hypothetical protein [Microbacterium stercoris]|uniref:SHOCT domain-containing protein n=1 Tax=Microbacterium stercoris TaxID=2820289 RepID=A0A939TM81_9MICO|nr:hypothetical protein [Microbacterium stercoris]MBO3662923.1 hypothetical protein [Microbacterium stercoris]